MLSTPLHLSVQVNSYNMVKFLVDKSCKLNVKTWDYETAFSLALKGKKYDIVKLLVNEDCDFENYKDGKGKT